MRHPHSLYLRGEGVSAAAAAAAQSQSGRGGPRRPRLLGILGDAVQHEQRLHGLRPQEVVAVSGLDDDVVDVLRAPVAPAEVLFGGPLRQDRGARSAAANPFRKHGARRREIESHLDMEVGDLGGEPGGGHRVHLEARLRQILGQLKIRDVVGRQQLLFQSSSPRDSLGRTEGQRSGQEAHLHRRINIIQTNI